MKRLPPAIRPKYRYISYNVHCEKDLEFETVIGEIWDTLEEYLGVRKLSEGEIWIMKNQYNKKHQKGVIKVQRSMEKDVIAALTLLSGFNDNKGFLQVENVSGTLKNI